MTNTNDSSSKAPFPADLHAAAMAVFDRAYAPYSNFHVAAALRCASGAVFTGCNVENAAYPEGWCAETSALGAMVTGGERHFVEAVVVGAGERLCTPCGGCRQRLNEFAAPGAVVHIADPDGPRAAFTMDELLPAGFVLKDEV